MKRCIISVTTIQTQLKTTIGQHLIAIRTAKTQKTITSAGEDEEQLGLSDNTSKCKMVRSGKHFGSLL